MATILKVEPSAPDPTSSYAITAQISHGAGSPIAQALAMLQALVMRQSLT